MPPVPCKLSPDIVCSEVKVQGSMYFSAVDTAHQLARIQRTLEHLNLLAQVLRDMTQHQSLNASFAAQKQVWLSG